jgi:hypothetical protein
MISTNELLRSGDANDIVETGFHWWEAWDKVDSRKKRKRKEAEGSADDNAAWKQNFDAMSLEVSHPP